MHPSFKVLGEKKDSIYGMQKRNKSKSKRKLQQKPIKKWKIFPHTCLRFVRFPIAADKVPERYWLGAPLQKKMNLSNKKQKKTQ